MKLISYKLITLDISSIGEIGARMRTGIRLRNKSILFFLGLLCIWAVLLVHF